jgi:membrane associated rhomboid family serine protease
MLPIGDDSVPGRGFAWLTATLIGLNVAVFVLLQGATGDNAFTYGFSAIPLEVLNGIDLVDPQQVLIGGQSFFVPQAPGPEPIQLTLLTSMFMHGGWLHLGGNMLFLWVFGDNVEHRAGPILFLAAYLGAGIVGSLAQVWVAPASPIPTLGASGAISGVLGAYIVLFPHNRVTAVIFNFVTRVPALVVIGMWIVLQLINGIGAAAISSETAGGVAYLAHIGGFAAGLAAGFVFRAALPSPEAERSRPWWG